MKVIEIYTDGSSKPNPGPGTGAYIVIDGKKVIYEESFYCEDSTNNIMELTAVIKALEYVDKNYPDYRVYLSTDSQYVQLGITEWLVGWKKRNWKTSANKPVSNRELWQELDKLYNKLTVHFNWVRGHSGNKWNEHVDKLCETKYQLEHEQQNSKAQAGETSGQQEQDQEVEVKKDQENSGRQSS